MTQPLITVKDLSVSYDGTEVLRCPELNIYPLDFIGVIGPNGGGKTTLIKALLKNVPYSGEIIYNRDIESNRIRKIGYLPQINTFDKWFPISVIEVVLSGLQAQKLLVGRYSKVDRSNAEELLYMTNVKRLQNRPIGELSGGELQRVMLCRALISNPQLLILDEPNNFVDSKFEKELYSLLDEFNKRMALIVVSHDLAAISGHIKSIVCVNKDLHYHNSNIITTKNLISYNCPVQQNVI